MQEIETYNVGMASNDTTFIPNFAKIGPVAKTLEGEYTYSIVTL
jgi:hypothetical protein